MAIVSDDENNSFTVYKVILTLYLIKIYGLSLSINCKCVLYFPFSVSLARRHLGKVYFHVGEFYPTVELTPGKSMTNFHFVADVVNFDHKQIKINSLD